MSPSEPAVEPPSRRGVVGSVLMAIGLLAGYGLGLRHFFHYLVPLRAGGTTREMFVGMLNEIPVGASLTVKDPQGREINIIRTSENPEHPEWGFRALSSKCPHLGCRVHWEAANDRFYCPCHAGAFDREGIAIAGPPAKEGKDLSRYELRVNRATGWVFVLVAEEHRYGV